MDTEESSPTPLCLQLLAFGAFPVLLLVLIGPMVAPETQPSNWPSNLPQWLAIINLMVCVVALAAIVYIRECARPYRAWVNYGQNLNR